MRGKRGKAYRKLMKQLQLKWAFHEPYRVLCDAAIIRDAARFAMDLQAALERTCQGKVQILVSQCGIRQLYAQAKEPGMGKIIDQAKTFERRFCGHHPDQYPEPLSDYECVLHCVNNKGKGENTHRYVIASQDVELRKQLRSIPGTPLIYIARSVMIMEPLSSATTNALAKEERQKLKGGIQKLGTTGKRKRDADDDGSNDSSGNDEETTAEGGQTEPLGRPRQGKRVAKGPNPLSFKKPKKKAIQQQPPTSSKPGDEPGKKKRKRKSKAKPEVVGSSDVAMAVEAVADGEED